MGLPDAINAVSCANTFNVANNAIDTLNNFILPGFLLPLQGATQRLLIIFTTAGYQNIFLLPAVSLYSSLLASHSSTVVSLCGV
jgi:hypothetical protein